VSSVVPTDKLPEVVLGRDRAYPRAQAMAELAASDRTDREALLSQVLDNSYEHRRYKAVAAIALGRIPTSAAENALLRNVTRISDETFPEVVLALGRIGGPSALEAIDALNLPPQHPGAGAAAYASALIAHRLGLPSHERPFPGNDEILRPDPKESRPIEVAKAKPDIARKVLQDLQQYPYGIAFDPDTLTETRCDGEVNVFCPNREFLGPAVVRLGERKAVLALGALRSEETGNYSVSYVVLSRPSGAATVAIMVHRCSGKLSLAGTGRIVDGRLEFELYSIRQPGARAVLVTGTMENGLLRVSYAIRSTTRERARVPARRAVERADRLAVLRAASDSTGGGGSPQRKR
jgi:hypothetical protein